jgi:hypothetical protein
MNFFAKNYTADELQAAMNVVYDYLGACKELEATPTVEGALQTITKALEIRDEADKDLR